MYQQSLFPSPRKIGLVGFQTDTGLGELSRQVRQYLPNLTDYYLLKHKKWPNKPYGGKLTVHSRAPSFLKKVDTVLFFETPIDPQLIPLAKRQGKRIVCVPMVEWLPKDRWTTEVDLFVCPTKACYEEVRRDGLPAVWFSWPTDTERYPYNQKSICSRFLFIHGHSGYKDRKGGDVIKKLLSLYPELPITIFSQKPEEWKGFDYRTANSSTDLYKDTGDVLLAPHRIDGIGLEILEASTSGIPTIVTEGPWWEEIYPYLSRIRASKESLTIGDRKLTRYSPDPEDLLDTCLEWLGKEIGAYSQSVRRSAVSNSWSNRVGLFRDLVLGIGV